MKDLLINTNVERLVKSEIKMAYAENETSKKICSEVSSATSAQGTLRGLVLNTLSKLSEDGTSQSNLFDLELAMNNLKIKNKIEQMKTLKATIEYCYKVLVDDETETYFVKENRKSMKNVSINDEFPCVMSDVLAPRKRTKDVTISSVDDSDIILNLTANDENQFQSKNKILFQKMTELNDKFELVIDEKQFDYTFVELVANFRKELRKIRSEVVESAENEFIEDAEIPEDVEILEDVA